MTVILRSSENENDSSLKSTFETLENQERLDDHDNLSYLNHLNDSYGPKGFSERVIDGELKSPDLLVDPKDGKWNGGNPMAVIIASCCIGRIFMFLTDHYVT